MKTIYALLLCVMTLTSGAQIDQLQIDPVLPGKKKFSTGLLTTFTGGPPPAMVVDLTYGVSNRTSLGLVGGTTGTFALYGLRLNTVLFEQNNLRGVFKLNMIYYPERNGTFLFDRQNKNMMAWMLNMGVADLEWRTKKNIRWSIGAGLLETHCMEGMMNWLRNSSEGGNLPFNVFTVAHGSIAIPVSPRLTIGPELLVAMKGLELVNKDEAKLSPINPFIHVVYAIGKKK